MPLNLEKDPEGGLDEGFSDEFERRHIRGHITGLICPEASEELNAIAGMMALEGPEEDWLANYAAKEPLEQELKDAMTYFETLAAVGRTDKERRRVRRNAHSHALIEGILRRKTDDGLRVALASKGRFAILKILHDDMGHFGVASVFVALRKKAWRPHMNATSQNYVLALP